MSARSTQSISWEKRGEGKGLAPFVTLGITADVVALKTSRAGHVRLDLPDVAKVVAIVTCVAADGNKEGWGETRHRGMRKTSEGMQRNQGRQNRGKGRC